MFNIGDIVRIVNSNGEYSITINGTIGKIISLCVNGYSQRMEIISLPTSDNAHRVGEAFPIDIKHMELVEEYATIPHAHVIHKIKIMQARFDKRKAALKKQKSTYVYLDEAILF